MCLGLVVACGEPPAMPGDARDECTQLVETICLMKVRCEYLRQDQYDACVDLFTGEFECETTRAVSPNHPSCIEAYEDACYDLFIGEFAPICEGVLLS
jgi:hypothetical protein